MKFAVVTTPYDAMRPRNFEYQIKSAQAYKSAAWAAANVLRDRNNWEYDWLGNPVWDKHLSVFEVTYASTELISVDRNGDVNWHPDFVQGDKKLYAAVRYIMAAMDNAVTEVREDAQSEMTPTEVETELDLKPGVVRKYIHDHRERLLANRVVRYADERTLLVRRGWALNAWGKSGEKQALAVDSSVLTSLDELSEGVWEQINDLDYGDAPAVKSEMAEYWRTTPVSFDTFQGYVEKVVYSTGTTTFRVVSGKKGHQVRDIDLNIFKQGDRIVIDYQRHTRTLGTKVKVLKAVGVF